MSPSEQSGPIGALAPVEIERLLTRAVVRGVRGLFADYGISAETMGGGPSRPASFPELWARIGFDGPGMGGHVVLGATPTLLSRSRPVASGEPDWLAELTNQLMGRVKNEMLRAGIQLQQGLPAVIAADDRGAEGADLLQWIFVADSGVIAVGIQVQIAEAVVPDPDLINWDVPPEGELLLF